MGSRVKILVTGSSGMLGADLVGVLTHAGGTVVGLDRSKLDITDREKTIAAIRDLKPGVVVNAAAYTDVDRAEIERDRAHKVNALGTSNLVTACEAVGAKLIHFGTDQVFDGTGRQPWTEDMIPRPLNHYAQTKLDGEREVLKVEDNLVLRVQWLYGRQKDRFSPLRNKDVFAPFDDQFGAPTWTLHIAQTVKELVFIEASGLYHFAYDDFASWAEVFGFVRDELKLKVKLEPRHTEDMRLPARRPKFSVLSNRKLLGCLERESMGSWRNALRTFLKSPR